MNIPRLPAFSATGDKRLWLAMHPKAFREWAMLPMAIQMQLPGIHGITPRWLPTRISSKCLVKEIRGREEGKNDHRGKKERVTLPADSVYVGQGHFLARFTTTKWTSPFTEGVHGQAAECILKYVGHIRSSELVHQVAELHGKRLVCECQAGDQWRHQQQQWHPK